MTTVRIPLKSAKHHFGAHCARGTRPYNEDTFQAGTIEIPAFARRAPVSVTSDNKDGKSAENESGDPQVFYFGVFDGHGGDLCSKFLRAELHKYLESAAHDFGMQSTLQGWRERRTRSSPEDPDMSPPPADSQPEGNAAIAADAEAQRLASKVVSDWKDTVGGYFRRFKPDFFPEAAGGKGDTLKPQVLRKDSLEEDPGGSADPSDPENSAIDQVLTYAFLKADFEFSTGHAVRPQIPQDSMSDPFDVAMGRHAHHSTEPFIGGSTSSMIMISTPSPMPFWNPSTPLSLVSAHLGDTRIILCSTATGGAIPLTRDHHPDSPTEASRLRRYAAAFTTDSFGEERFAAGLANTRSFGDSKSKRMGVSAEPDLALVHLKAAECSFLVLVSDGVSGVLSDQEIVDVVKEAKTPADAATNVVRLAEEIALGTHGSADNATALCVRLGGWERRNEGGNGSLGTRDYREYRRQEASDPRRGRT